jgi:hypothetical protein
MFSPIKRIKEEERAASMTKIDSLRQKNGFILNVWDRLRRGFMQYTLYGFGMHFAFEDLAFINSKH